MLKKIFYTLAIIIMLGIIVTVYGVFKATDKTVNELTKDDHTIEYKVTSSAPAKVDYWQSGGNSGEQFNGNWDKKIDVKGTEVPILTVTTADFMNTNNKVSCEIIIDGKSMSKNENTTSASCSANTLDVSK